MTGWATISGQEWIAFVTVYAFYFFGFVVNACPQDDAYCPTGQTCIDRCLAGDDDLSLLSAASDGGSACPALPYVCSASAPETTGASTTASPEPSEADAETTDGDADEGGDASEDTSLSTTDVALIVASSVLFVLIVIVLCVIYRPYKSRARYAKLAPVSDNL